MKALVIDFGLCIEHSLSLLKFYDEVYYYIPWQDAFPRYLNAILGSGFEDEGLIRILNFWDYVDEVDTIAVFDTFLGDLVNFLRTKGYNVWGTSLEEKLENDRWYSRKIQQKIGLPTQKTELIKGLDNLREYLKKEQNKVVKLNTFRGSLETFIHYDYKSSEPLLDHLAIELSVMKNKVNFVVEELLQGIEPGTDLYVVDGRIPSKYLWGFELKGMGYVAKIDDREKIPEPLRTIDEKMSQVLTNARTLYSTETILTDDGVCYLIDNCIRAPMPCPSACEMVVFENFAEIIHHGARGDFIEPKIRDNAKYVASVALESDWANEHFVEIIYPQEYREFIKFRKVIKDKDKIYAVPGFSSVCAVVGYGNTLQDAIDMCKRIADEIKGYQLEKNYTGFEKVFEEIEKLKKFNIEF